jgi:hypothetical protein
LVLGTDQERALRPAATAAVRLTAEELRQDDEEQTELERWWSAKFFGQPVPSARPTMRKRDGIGRSKVGADLKQGELHLRSRGEAINVG